MKAIGAACRRAKGYRSGKCCDVKLQPDRTSGKFLADGSTLLVVNYESDCEPHATNFGGAAIFEQKDGATLFKGYQPGFQANNCIILCAVRRGWRRYRRTVTGSDQRSSFEGCRPDVAA